MFSPPYFPGIKDKSLPADVNVVANLDAMSPEDRKAEMIKTVAKYYNCWEPPPIPAQRMVYLDKDILPKIQYDACKFALTCRGKRIGEFRLVVGIATVVFQVCVVKL